MRGLMITYSPGEQCVTFWCEWISTVLCIRRAEGKEVIVKCVLPARNASGMED